MNRYQIEVARQAEKHGMTVTWWEDMALAQVWKNGVPFAAILEDGGLEEYREVRTAPGIEQAVQKLHRISDTVNEFLTLFDEADEIDQDIPNHPLGVVLKKVGGLRLVGEDCGLFDGFRFYIMEKGKVKEKYPARKFRQAKQEYLELVGHEW